MDNNGLLLLLFVAFIINALISLGIAFYGKKKGGDFKQILLVSTFLGSMWGTVFLFIHLRRKKVA